MKNILELFSRPIQNLETWKLKEETGHMTWREARETRATIFHPGSPGSHSFFKTEIIGANLNEVARVDLDCSKIKISDETCLAMVYHGALVCEPDSESNFHGHDPHSRQNRKFDISDYEEGFDLISTAWEEPSGFTLTPCPHAGICKDCGGRCRPKHADSIIIAIDGACRGNGTPSAAGAIGVYFAEDSEYNVAEVIQGSYPTNQKAELLACVGALKAVARFQLSGAIGLPRLSQVVIKTDSEYVVKGLTEWVFKWRTNGYRNVRGIPVINADLFQCLDKLVNGFYQTGLIIDFFHVPRARNKEADALANAALDAVSPKSRRARR